MTGYPKTIALSRRSGQKQDFLIRRCIDTDLYEILRLQRIIDEDLADPGIYSLVDEEDILESLKVDHCYGAYVDGRLVGFTAMIDNRYSLNNLQKEGYEIIDTRPLYGGAMRHILRKVL